MKGGGCSTNLQKVIMKNDSLSDFSICVTTGCLSVASFVCLFGVLFLHANSFQEIRHDCIDVRTCLGAQSCQSSGYNAASFQSVPD